MSEEAKKPKPHPGKFKPGQSGNPKGRPPGSKNKLGEKFLKALHDDFKKHGIASIEKMRAEDPGSYIKVIAALTPKQVDSNVNHNASNDFVELMKIITSGNKPKAE